MDENPYTAPQATSNGAAESGGRQRHVGWGMTLFILGLLWIIAVAAIDVPVNAVDPRVRVSHAEYLVFLIVASSPAVVLFWLAKRALH